MPALLQLSAEKEKDLIFGPQGAHHQVQRKFKTEINQYYNRSIRF